MPWWFASLSLGIIVQVEFRTLIIPQMTFQRDLQYLVSAGFPEVRVKKALFAASAVLQEAMCWLIAHQHDTNIDEPWNMTELQVRQPCLTLFSF